MLTYMCISKYHFRRMASRIYEVFDIPWQTRGIKRTLAGTNPLSQTKLEAFRNVKVLRLGSPFLPVSVYPPRVWHFSYIRPFRDVGHVLVSPQSIGPYSARDPVPAIEGNPHQHQVVHHQLLEYCHCQWRVQPAGYRGSKRAAVVYDLCGNPRVMPDDLSLHSQMSVGRL